ncbi:MAG: DNA-binding protein [Cytophagaceae bacterium]|nr:MAG: DNA-binding protein [Cytophagaceae bacterium]
MPHTPLLRESEAAIYLSLAQKTLQRRRWAGQPPSYIKIGAAVRYSQAELDSFIAGGEVKR